jgi:oligopeptide/dipeptide ABC transporter ATP-binding protein
VGAPDGLAVRDLCVSIRSSQTPIVEDVSLDVAAGQVRGVVGETGAGKTLVMKALLGLLPPTLTASGRFRVGDGAWAEVGVQDRARRRLLAERFGVVLQNPAAMLDPLMRVGRQLTEGVRLRRILTPEQAGARALQLLGAVGFKDAEAVLRLYPHQLSGGMKQRVGIAMAMMSRPAALIVDEPTSALDAQLRVDVLALIREMAVRERSAVIVVSHDLGLLSGFCDVITVLYGGRVMEEGDAGAVLADPRHPYTEALVHCSPTVAATPHEALATIAGMPPAPGRRPVGCVFSPRCPAVHDRCLAERPLPTPTPQGSAACHLVDDAARAQGRVSRA